MENKKEKGRILFWESKGALANLDLNLNHFKELIQISVKQFNRLLKGESCVTLNELETCLSPEPYRHPIPERVESLLRGNLLKGKDFKALKGLNIGTLIDLPDYSGLLESLEKFTVDPGCIPSCDPGSLRAFNAVLWQCYSLNDEVVSFNLKEIEVIKESYRAYAETTEEKERLNRVNKFCSALNSFIKKEPDLIKPEKLQIRNLIYWDEENSKFQPCEIFPKYGRY